MAKPREVLAQRQQRPVTKCRSCGAHVFWVVSDRTGGKFPVDVQPDDEGHVLVDGTYYTSHFATCPQAQRWRKKKSKGK
jgi:hypothetical protein